MLRQQQKEDSRRIQLSLLVGELTLEHLQIGLRGDDLAITVGQQPWPWESYPTSVGTLINLGRPLTLKPGDILTIQVLGDDDEDALPEAEADAPATEADADDLIAAEDES
jgi:hypothetical protein